MLAGSSPQCASPSLTVACLCAAWCRTCDDYQAAFAEVARAHAQARFVWIDIEEHSDVLGGDLDVENFPTLALLRGVNCASSAPCCRMPPRWTAWSPRRGRPAMRFADMQSRIHSLLHRQRRPIVSP